LRESPIALYEERLIEVAQKFGVNYTQTRNIKASTHAQCKLARAIVDKLMLIEALEKCKDFGLPKIVDFYGSLRGWDLWERATAKATTMLGVEPVKWSWYRPLITSKDHLDYKGLLQRHPSDNSTSGKAYFLIQDIYQPVSVLMKELTERPDFVAGCASTQIFLKQVVAGIKFETLPFVQVEGLIKQACDFTDHTWPATYTNDDWIAERQLLHNGRWIVWDTFRKVIHYSIFKIQVAESKPVATIREDVVDPDSVIEIKVLTAKTIRHRVLNWVQRLTWQTRVFDRDLFVFMPAVRKLSGSMTMKNRQTYQISNIQKEIHDLMAQEEYEPLWHLVHEAYPKAKLVLDTITYLCWAGFEDDYSQLEAITRVLGPQVTEFKTMKNSMAPPERKFEQKWGPILGFGIGALIVMRFLMKRKQIIAAFMQQSVSALAREVQTEMDRSSALREMDFLLKWWQRLWLWLEVPIAAVSGFFPKDQQNGVQRFLFAALVPAIEEWFKSYFGWFGCAVLASVETMQQTTLLLRSPAVNLLPENHNIYHHIFGTTLGKTLMHRFMSSFKNAVTVHYGWNALVAIVLRLPWNAAGAATGGLASLLLCQSGHPPGTFEQFKEDHDNVVSHISEYTQDFRPLKEDEAFLQATQMAPIYPDTPIAEAAILETETNSKMYILIQTTACFYRPHGPLQFWHAYKQRNCDRVPITPICEEPSIPLLPHQQSPWTHCKFGPGRPTSCPIGKRWRHASNIMRNVLDTASYELPEPLKSEEWIRKFKGAAKKARARTAIEQRNNGDIVVRSGIFLKADEVLFGRDGALKGRTVKSLDPTIQALTYQSIEQVVDQLKQVFDGSWAFPLGDWQLTFAIGSGKTGDALDKWFLKNLDWISLGKKRAACIFAGDDFYALVHEHDHVQAYENDFSKFDRTQGVHALGAECRILIHLGMEPRKARLLFETQLATPRYQVERYEIKKRLPMEAQRATGGPDTTIGNTLSNMMSVMYAVRTSNGFKDLDVRQLELGFLAKLQVHDDYMLATFLKGWWMPTRVDLQWLPLPSQVVKIGKILTDPRSIFPHLAPPQAWRAAAASMAASYGTIPHTYPLFGPFLKRYAELTDVTTDLMEVHQLAGLAYRTRRDFSRAPDREVVLDYFIARYGLTLADIEEMEQEIVNVPFPGLLCHVGWAVVARRDYG
jgi:hypothetical protein